MTPIELSDDDGFVEVTIKGADGVSSETKDLDLYETCNKLFDLARKHRDKPTPEYHTGVATLLRELGFPAVSHRTASRFAKQIFERVDQLKNADGGEPTPGSPVTTAPEPSASPAPTS